MEESLCLSVLLLLFFFLLKNRSLTDKTVNVDVKLGEDESHLQHQLDTEESDCLLFFPNIHALTHIHTISYIIHTDLHRTARQTRPTEIGHTEASDVYDAQVK